MTGPQVCTHCLAELARPMSNLAVITNQDPDLDPAEISMMYQVANGGTLGQRRDLILRLFELTMAYAQINNYRVRPPVTTWRGDPVCELHLGILADEARAPQTVRMAQWGPRR